MSMATEFRRCESCGVVSMSVYLGLPCPTCRHLPDPPETGQNEPPPGDSVRSV